MQELSKDRDLVCFLKVFHLLWEMHQRTTNAREDQRKNLVELETSLILEVKAQLRPVSINYSQTPLVMNILIKKDWEVS